jgi:LPXTG-motif cell wall-anchored protein
MNIISLPDTGDANGGDFMIVGSSGVGAVRNKS